jgi:hypothetical protein
MLPLSAREAVMALYSFFPCRTDGTSLSFETLEVRDDAEAFVQAAALLQQHTTAAYVAVWLGDRSVCSVPRDPANMSALTQGNLTVGRP